MREVERVFRERRLALDGPAAPFVAEAVFVELDARVGALLRAPPAPAEVLRARLDAIDRALWAVERVRDAHVVAASYRVGQAFEHAAERLRDPSLRRRAIERYVGAVHASQSSGAPSLFADAARSRLREIDTRAAVDAVIRAQAAPSLHRRASAGAPLLETAPVYTTHLAR